MTKKKKLLTAALSIVLAAVIAVGGTLAYLFTITDKKTNVFTFADNIKADLEEPSWDPTTSTDLTPGAELPKDPQITNTSVDNVDEYVAIKLKFTRGDGTVLTDAEMTKLLTLVTIDWGNSWTRIEGTASTPVQTYEYNEKIQPNETTDPVFYKVTINSDVTPEDQKWLAGDFGHDESCYTFPACDCTMTYKHHERCALRVAQAAGVLTPAQVAAAIKGATVLGSDANPYTCDCTPSEIHESTCASLNGSIALDPAGVPLCGHTTLISGLGGFNIEVAGAAVQASEFANAAAAAADLVTLLA